MNIKIPVYIALIMLLGTASCKKEVDDAPDRPATTNLNVINATADTLNFYQNGSRINIASSLYPLGAMGYTGVAVGERTYQFKRIGRAAVLFDLPLAIDSAVTYSVFVAGLSADNAFSVRDTLVADTASRVKVRFVNASPDAGTLDVRVGEGDTVNFKLRPFKSATTFLTIGPGIKHIRVYQSGSAVPRLDITRPLLSGRIYTIYAKGTAAGVGDNAFGTGLVVNR